MEDFNKKFRINELKIFESEHWVWSLRPQQVTLGSGILSLKRKCDSFSKIDSFEMQDLEVMIKKIEAVLKKAFNYGVINYLMLMMVDKQVHFHVLPRYGENIDFLNITWEDKDWPKASQLVPFEVDNEVLIKLKNHLYEISENEATKKKKYKIGYTTGVYDMFHIGHLNILKKAKEQCEYLIVGVTTDELVSYKNKKAVIPHEERMKIVESIKYVDKVVSQSTMDKMAAWELYKFNAMFVGSDWQGTEKWLQFEKDFAEKQVDIVYFTYTAGRSSTQLRNILKDKS